MTVNYFIWSDQYVITLKTSIDVRFARNDVRIQYLRWIVRNGEKLHLRPMPSRHVVRPQRRKTKAHITNRPQQRYTTIHTSVCSQRRKATPLTIYCSSFRHDTVLLAPTYCPNDPVLYAPARICHTNLCTTSPLARHVLSAFPSDLSILPAPIVTSRLSSTHKDAISPEKIPTLADTSSLHCATFHHHKVLLWRALFNFASTHKMSALRLVLNSSAAQSIILCHASSCG